MAFIIQPTIQTLVFLFNDQYHIFNNLLFCLLLIIINIYYVLYNFHSYNISKIKILISQSNDDAYYNILRKFLALTFVNILSLFYFLNQIYIENPTLDLKFIFSIFTLSFSGLGIFQVYYSHKKNDYINTVTQERIKWIHLLKEQSSCLLESLDELYFLININSSTPINDEDEIKDKIISLQIKINSLIRFIEINLNTVEESELCNILNKFINYPQNPNYNFSINYKYSDIKYLHKKFIYLFKKEWEIVKVESEYCNFDKNNKERFKNNIINNKN